MCQFEAGHIFFQFVFFYKASNKTASSIGKSNWFVRNFAGVWINAIINLKIKFGEMYVSTYKLSKSKNKHVQGTKTIVVYPRQ